MKEYLSHFSAAVHWKIPYIENVSGTEIVASDADSGGGAAATAEITVSDRRKRFQRKGHKIHLCERELPRGAVTLRDGIRVAAPELLFLQLAPKLSVHRLILLGLQLCSHPPGMPVDAITTKNRLAHFLAKTTCHRGSKKALRAVKYLEDGSASVMESMVYMILTLPHALGGYGLGEARFNYEIGLKDESGNHLGQKRCFADLYYKSEKVAVEYDSFAFHNSPTAQGRDAIRSSMLDSQGIQVMHLNTIQLYNRKACENFALNLAGRLGRRIQIRAEKFDEMNTLLRALLPTGPSD